MSRMLAEAPRPRKWYLKSDFDVAGRGRMRPARRRRTRGRVCAEREPRSWCRRRSPRAPPKARALSPSIMNFAFSRDSPDGSSQSPTMLAQWASETDWHTPGMSRTTWVLPDGEPSWPLWVKSRRRRGTIHYQPNRANWVHAPCSGSPSPPASSRPIEHRYADALLRERTHPAVSNEYRSFWRVSAAMTARWTIVFGDDLQFFRGVKDCAMAEITSRSDVQ